MNRIEQPSRRTFLKTAALAAAGAGLSPRSWAQVPNANSDVRIAVVGLHGRGKTHVEAWQKATGVRLVALCDVDSAVLGKAHEKVPSARTYSDIRKLLDDPGIDAISIATPNHWHSLAAIWACQAGKDVYVEKPVSHNVWEGRQLVNAAAKYNRVVQAGMQIRSSPGIIEAQSWIQGGNLGKIKVCRGLCYKRRPSIGLIHGPGVVPPTVDYDIWVGPAPMEPPHRRQFHYDWHWFWPTGNGDLGNQGIHQMDLARWFLGEPTIAPATLTVGGRFGYIDNAETPNTVIVVHHYKAAPLVFEVRGLPAHSRPGDASIAPPAGGEAGPTDDSSGKMDRYPKGPHGASIGIVVECEGGTLVIPSYTDAYAYDPQGKRIKQFGGKNDIVHFQNFIDVVHSRRVPDLRGPVSEGHLSAALCHTGNVSYRLGQQMGPDEIRERAQSNPDMTEAFGRMVEHLANNGVDLRKTPAKLGVPLMFNPKAERFVHNHEANQLLTRNYRAPYVVPAVT